MRHTDQRIYLDGTLAASRPNATSLEAGYSSAKRLEDSPVQPLTPVPLTWVNTYSLAGH